MKAFFMAFVMLMTALLSQTTTVRQEITVPDGSEKKTVTEPVSSGASDPWFVEHDGMYYYCYSTGWGAGVKKSENIYDLFDSEGGNVYTAPRGEMYSEAVWAPELHYINGEWYIYYAASDGPNENHRMYVLKGTSQDPTQPFEMVGKINDPSDKWAIDGTVLQLNDELYFIWSGWEGDTDGQQNLYIAHMSSPTVIDSERVCISVPEKKWEKKGMPINEGPEILTDGNNIYLTYSASGSWTDDYCIGMLRLNGGDPMKADNWKKCPLPVFSKGNDVYGPGHASFIKAKDGTDYIVYHGNSEQGSGWNGRQGRIQKFTWVNGVPFFGKPVKDGKNINFAK